MRYIEVLEQCLGKKAQKNMLPLQPGDVPDTCADVDDLVQRRGLPARHPVEVGVRRFVDWYLRVLRAQEVTGACAVCGRPRGSAAPIAARIRPLQMPYCGPSGGDRMPDSKAQQAPSMQVPLLDLKPQYQPLESEIHAAIEKVCASQASSSARPSSELEASVAAYCQCRFGIGVSSGTDALLWRSWRSRSGRGTRSSPARSRSSPPRAPSRAPARGRTFCDIEPDTFNISPAAVRVIHRASAASVTDGKLHQQDTQGVIKAIMPVHLYGQVADMGPLMQIARAIGLQVIEDAAQAIGVGRREQGPRRAASATWAACRSFPPRTSARSAMPACA